MRVIKLVVHLSIEQQQLKPTVMTTRQKFETTEAELNSLTDEQLAKIIATTIGFFSGGPRSYMLGLCIHKIDSLYLDTETIKEIRK